MSVAAIAHFTDRLLFQIRQHLPRWDGPSPYAPQWKGRGVETLHFGDAHAFLMGGKRGELGWTMS